MRSLKARDFPSIQNFIFCFLLNQECCYQASAHNSLCEYFKKCFARVIEEEFSVPKIDMQNSHFCYNNRLRHKDQNRLNLV